MILYHASTVRIKSFYVPYGGIHMGGIHSALEAALRKARNYCGSEDLSIYLHRLEVDLGRVVMMDDMGDCQAWRETINTCTEDGFNCVEYKNLFEPDTCNSYMIWEPSRIEILSIETMSQDKAEDMINEFYDSLDI